MPSYNYIHPSFKLNAKAYTINTLIVLAQSYKNSNANEEKVMGEFLTDWLNNKSTINVYTSGSTGVPKVITLEKQAMINSAVATGAFFDLKAGYKALQCLSSTYIAGKMMLVRAMILGLELDVIPPTSKPLETTNKYYDFCAMVPLQLEHSFGQLHQIKVLIVGGTALSPRLYPEILKSSCMIYETYGMTETITHIAVKHIKGMALSNFKILPHIEIRQDDRQCLVINAPHINVKHLVTNDIVALQSSSEFRLLGRFDNVINTGGIKVFPEQIEFKLNPFITSRFFIASKPDKVLGQKVILILESAKDNLSLDIFNGLKKFEKPKEIYTIVKFLETSSGKIKREETLNSIFNN
ncbi:MAG: AMP-binding protein [Flavobacteriaceae bacterium]|nr:AMP-binding protein [Flavobacteriaceae bacterium]